MGKKLFKALPAVAIAAVMAFGLISVSACGPDGKTENLTDEPLKGEMLADFTQGEADAVFASNGWTNGSVFNTWWTADNVQYANGAMKLTVKDNPDGAESTNNEYFGGEARTYQYFGYGDYEVRMKPSKKAGTASTFFTCTGNYDTNPHTGEANPWDEIDIEFLGKDTTQVQFNYFVNGVGGHEYMYDLGFDASEEFHNYGFRWTEDYITWFVDGEPVYRVDATESKPMPSAAGRMLMNYWVGTSKAEGWMGKFSEPDDQGPEYQWVKTSAKVDWGEIPEKVDAEEFEGDWADYDAISPEFESSMNAAGATEAPYKFTPSADGKSVNIKWAAGTAANYDNANFAVDESVAEGKNWVRFVLKNNSSEQTHNIRINVRTTAETTSNQYAFGSGTLLVTTPNEGTTLSLSPNQEMEIEIKYDGTVASIELMMDSMQASPLNKAGDITISDIKFATQGEVVDIKPSENNGIDIGGQNVKFEASAYVINTDSEANSMNVTYSAVKGNAYSVISAGVTAVAADKSEFTFKVKNNGAETVKLRVDLLAGDKNMVNGVSVAGDSVHSYTASDSAVVEVVAGATETVTVTFAGTIATANIFIDSCTWNDEESHSGDITFSEMAFAGEGQEVEPETPVVVPESGEVNLTFTSTDKYTVDKSGVAADEVNVTYTDVTGATYANIQSDAKALAAGRDTFTITIKNNGTEAATVRVDLIGENKVSTSNGASTDVCNLSHQSIGGTNGNTDTVYGGTSITVAAGETVTLIIKYDGEGAWGAVQRVQVYMDSSTHGDTATHAGNITLSGFKFTSSEAAA